MLTIYPNKDNKIELQLLVDGVVVDADTVTKAVLWFPAEATTTGTELSIDTDNDSEITLNADATEVSITTGNLPLNIGCFKCYLTIYDVANQDGIAWSTLKIKIKEWQE